MLYDFLFILVIFISNIIQTITGFAGTVLAMPFSIKFVGVDTAKPVLNLVALLVSLYIVIFHFKDIDWKHFLIIIISVGVGFALGFLVEMFLGDNKILLYIYGGIIIVISILFFFINFEKVNLPKWLMIIFLIIGGIIHKLYVSGGPFVVIYGLHEIKEKNKFRATLSLLWIILNSILFATQITNGLFTAHVWILFGIGAGITILSIFIGSLIAPKLSKNVFMKITCVLLFISGVILLI
jgi:uncharacterized protein